MICTHATVPASEITRRSLKRLGLRDVCLQCWIIANDITCWCHPESECVFLVDLMTDPEGQFAYECDEITTTQFFDLIQAGWAYDILP